MESKISILLPVYVVLRWILNRGILDHESENFSQEDVH